MRFVWKPFGYGDTKMTQYKYEGLGRLVTENTDGVTITYAYDKKGNRTSMKVTGSVDEPYTTSYTYDKNNRLTKEVKTYTSDYDREVTDYYYDPNGNMISKAKSAHTKSSAFITMSMLPSTVKGSGVYEYNGFNQLVRANESGAISTYTYDADGLRQSKTVAGVTTNHIWDGTNMVAETNSSGAVTSVYTRGMQLISAKSGDDTSYYIHNGHGDVTALMDASGNVTKEYAYDAFGVEENIDSADTNPFRYCGEYYDKESGNIYLRARYYSPVQGRFTTEDPIRDGLNWYAYCGGNPVMFMDYWGLEQIVVSGGNYGKSEGYEYNFIELAIKKIRELREAYPEENIAWCIANEGWTEEDWDNFAKVVADLNVSIVVINSKQDLINYINCKNTLGIVSDENGNPVNYRTGDEITKFVVFSHGLGDGTLSLGYNYKSDYNTELDMKISDISLISSDAFNNPSSWFYSCNTATYGENSFLKHWYDKVGGFAGGYIGYTSYYDIMGLQGYNRWNKEWREYYDSIKQLRKEYGFCATGAINYPTGDEDARQVTYQ